MNNYDELLFNGKIKKCSKNKNNLESSNTYRGQDISEYPHFIKNMKKYRKRLFDLLKSMMYSNDEKYPNSDENDIMTTKFIEFCNEVFVHFENMEKITDVNHQFSVLSKIDKVLLVNNSS